MTTKPSMASNRRVLIVDDNRAIHDDFRKILGGGSAGAKALDAAAADLFGGRATSFVQPTFDLQSALQGQEALTLVQQAVRSGERFAVAFVDVRMPPGWDGIETTAKLWEADPDLQIVICTAYSDYSLDDILRKLGQTDRLVVLKKPFDNVEVRQLANALTEKWCLLQGAKAKIEDLERMVGERTVALTKSEARFRIIAENAADLIAVVDPQGKRIYNSPSYKKVLDLSPEELARTSAFDQVHPDDRPKVIAATQACAQTGVGQMLDYRMQHRDGSWRVIESQSTPVFRPDGTVEHLVIVARDITARKHAEDERAIMEIELRHAQKMESIGQLAAGIAHEINTPTQYIGDNIRFLQDAFSDLSLLLEAYGRFMEKAREGFVDAVLIEEAERAASAADVTYLAREIPKAIEQSLQGIGRVSKIVRAMKEFSHPGVEEKVPLDLNHAIESTLTVATNALKYVANIVTEFDPNLPPVPCLPGEFNQVILNVAINAAHAIADVVGDGGKSKGTITVTTRRLPEAAEIRIRDTGVGIPVAIRRRIFDPFFTTKPVGQGTGQGLAIAHSVVIEKHGGTIDFESEVGVGTTFIIRLPLVASGKKSAPQTGPRSSP